MSYTPSQIRNKLQKYGELHVYSDEGAEFHVHKHDTSVQDKFMVIDSKDGRWDVPVEKIEHIEYPVSHKE